MSTKSMTVSANARKEFAGKFFQPHQIGYWTSVLYLCGSSNWIANAILLFHNLVPVDSRAVAWTAFAGGTFFLFGGLSHFWELLNEGNEGNFGDAVMRACGVRSDAKKTSSSDDLELRNDSINTHGQEDQDVIEEAKWKWWFKLDDLKNLKDSTAATELLAVSIFWISVFYGVIVNTSNESEGLDDALYWTPQVVGAFFLTLSSVLGTVNEQEKWYIPALQKANWHVGFWNVVGSVGFFLSGFFGYWIMVSSDIEVYGVFLSTYWGSYAFMIGSVLQTIMFFVRHYKRVHFLFIYHCGSVETSQRPAIGTQFKYLHHEQTCDAELL